MRRRRDARGAVGRAGAAAGAVAAAAPVSVEPRRGGRPRSALRRPRRLDSGARGMPRSTPNTGGATATGGIATGDPANEGAGAAAGVGAGGAAAASAVFCASRSARRLSAGDPGTTTSAADGGGADDRAGAIVISAARPDDIVVGESSLNPNPRDSKAARTASGAVPLRPSGHCSSSVTIWVSLVCQVRRVPCDLGKSSGGSPDGAAQGVGDLPMPRAGNITDR